MSDSTILSPICQLLKKFSQEKILTDSSISSSLKKSETFKNLINANAIIKKRKGAGWIWEVEKYNVITNYLSYKCPVLEKDVNRGDRYNNIKMTRNSKSKNRDSYRLVFTRGRCKYSLNDEHFYDTSKDAVGKQLNKLITQKLCFMENLESFMINKHLIDEGWLLIFVVGRIGKTLLQRIQAKEVMHLGDLDYVGLNEYATIAKEFSDAILYVPNNYFQSASETGTDITSSQKASKLLLNLSQKDKKVKKVLDFLHEENVYLEQEGYDNE